MAESTMAELDWVKWAAEAHPGMVIPAGYNSDLILGELARRVLALEARLDAKEAAEATSPATDQATD